MVSFLVVDMRSVEMTIRMSRICKCVTHSDVNKSICRRQTNWYRSNNARSALFWEFGSTCMCSWNWLKDWRCDYEHWMRSVFHSSRRLLVDPPSSRGVYKILNLLRVNLTSETLSEPMSTHQQNYESNVSSDKTLDINFQSDSSTFNFIH